MNEATIGHNNPPSDQEIVRESLETRTEDLRARHDELLAAVDRMPSSCDDDETAGKFGDMIKLITACAKSLEAKRVDEKEPYLTLSRVVDGFFKRYTDNLASAKIKVSRPLEVFLKRKEDERRRAAAEEAARQRAEAERVAAEAAALAAAKMNDLANQTMNEAIRIDEQAIKSEKLAEAKPSELARTRGDYGSLATLRTVWVGEIIDRDSLDRDSLWPYIPAEALQKAVNAFVRAGGRELRGAKIFEQSSAQVR